jgi:threonine/homoserine/homoserine lactone efflux protein
MTEILPTAPVFAAFTLAAFVLIVTPGPDMTLQLSKTLAHGRAAGVATVLGSSAGMLIHTLAAALGVSALLATSPAAFQALQIVGALYLLWLALDAIRNGSALSVEAGTGGDIRLARLFGQAFLINLLNPKVVLFFVTFLPQFVDAGDPHAGAKLVLFGLWQIALGVPLLLAMVWSAGAISAALKRRPKVLRAMDYAFATLFGGFALKLLAARAAG